MAFGLGECVGAVLFGKMSDQGYFKASVAIGFVSFTSALSLLVMFKNVGHLPPLFPPPDHGTDTSGSVSFLCFLTALLFGLGDSAYQTVLFFLNGALFPEQGDTAFAVFQAWQQIGSITGFALPLVLPLETSNWPVVVQGVVLFIATCTLLNAASPPKVSSASQLLN